MKDKSNFLINQRLKKLRICKKLTRDELAIKLGIKSGQIAAIENDRQLMPAWYLEAINNKWPEHVYWLATGIQIPEQGHIEPREELAEDFIEKKLNENKRDHY
jgi:transcriptional regulator with XRE-family HTH domain